MIRTEKTLSQQPQDSMLIIRRIELFIIPFPIDQVIAHRGYFYFLFAVIYGDGEHLTARIFCVSESNILEYDGMERQRKCILLPRALTAPTTIINTMTSKSDEVAYADKIFYLRKYCDDRQLVRVPVPCCVKIYVIISSHARA